MTTEIAFAITAMVVSLACATFSGTMTVRARRQRIQAEADLNARLQPARLGCVPECEPDCNGTTPHHAAAVLAQLGSPTAREILDQHYARVEATIKQITDEARHEDIGILPDYLSIARVRATCNIQDVGTCICARVVRDQIRHHHQAEDGDK